MYDLQLSDGVEFAMTALDNLKEKCLSEWNKDPDALIPDDAFCFNECSMQGQPFACTTTILIYYYYMNYNLQHSLLHPIDVEIS